jgi:hypothetical protein
VTARTITVRPTGALRKAALSDALALPPIAFRGLWDRFAAPFSLESLRRAYLRGVPSLVRCVGVHDADQALAVVADPAANRRRQPAVLILDSLGWLTPRGWTDRFPPLFAIDGRDPCDRRRAICRWVNGVWVTVGSYIPLGASAHIGELAGVLESDAVVMFESTNVTGDIGTAPVPAAWTDDATLNGLRPLVRAGAAIYRVSDLVELDWLRSRVREAA